MSTASLKEKVKTINPENFAALPLLIEVEQDFLFTNMSFLDHISWGFFRPQYYTITMQRFYIFFPNTDLDRKFFFPADLYLSPWLWLFLYIFLSRWYEIQLKDNIYSFFKVLSFAHAYVTLLGSLSNHDDDDNKNPTNLHIWQWKTVLLHALHVHFSFFAIL